MALKLTISFPLFLPPTPNPTHQRPATAIGFSRWNNANAQKFILRERAQQEIEDEIRLHRRFESALKIADIDDNATSTAAPTTVKSIGTPSAPSRSSIPGKASKYSKPPKPPKISHPAFRRIVRTRKLPDASPEAETAKTGIKVSDDGVSYVIPGAPFEFQYSYTETPKVKPLKLREPPYAPFGPGTMPRPWTGRAPLPASKKKLKEFDSFVLPPPHKKGVKPVQAPGPFLPGSGPKYVMSREEILGEPLTKEETEDLIQGSRKTKRQLNMGRDGLTHNMLDNIHAHWKRRRVCKIKCKGVCTVDMDTVCQQLEEKTGGKIIYCRGGVIYLYRGRNYNYKSRPRFPLMLWKPVTPVYPRLVQQAPEGLTLKEATEMRHRAHKLTPICKLGKNGVYWNLVRNVREAFEECELVRINCRGMNSSDYHKIGAKLKDLVPCVLISFQHEHILMWRGRNWKFMFSTSEDHKKANDSENVATTSSIPPLEGQEVSASIGPDTSAEDVTLNRVITGVSPLGTENIAVGEGKDMSSGGNDKPFTYTGTVSTVESCSGSESTSYEMACDGDESKGSAQTSGSKTIMNSMSFAGVVSGAAPEVFGSTEIQSEDFLVGPVSHGMLQDTSQASQDLSKPTPCTEEVLALWKQALEGGSAIVLDNNSLDADLVYQRAVALARSAPPGPVFMSRPKKVATQKQEKQETEDFDEEEVTTVRQKNVGDRGSVRNQPKKDFCYDYLNVVPEGSLRVDELAKLLA